jgi:hypothetical protein
MKLFGLDIGTICPRVRKGQEVSTVLSTATKTDKHKSATQIELLGWARELPCVMWDRVFI